MIGKVVRALVASGATPEMILAAVEAHEEHTSACYADEAARVEALAEARREKDRERKRNKPASATFRDVPAESSGSRRTDADTDGIQSAVEPAAAVSRAQEITSLGSKPELLPKDPPKGGPKGKVQTSKGTRLPENFEPDLGEVLALGLSLERAISEAAKFCDHFRAAPGQRGVKVDWNATWRNWLRRAAEDGPRSATGPPRQRANNGWTDIALGLAGQANDAAVSNDFSASDSAGYRRGNGQASAPDRFLDAERSAPAGNSRPGSHGR